MLPKKNRLSRRPLTLVIARGRKTTTTHLSLKVLSGNGATAKLSVVAGKRVARKATERNLLCRRLYHVLERLLPSLPGGFTGVIIAKPGVTALSFHQLSQEMSLLFTRAGLLEVTPPRVKM